MFFVQDDHTVRELDGNESLAVYAGLGIGGAVSKEYGHFSAKIFEAYVGEDLNNNTFGINEVSIDTAYLTNKLHKWFADKGYKVTW